MTEDADRSRPMDGSPPDRPKFRRRDDHAVELFREALGNLDDVARIDRILLELGRFYNPFLNGAIVDLASRRRVLEALAGGKPAEARRLLEERLALYAGVHGEA